jgi:hypothetical protein
MNDDIRNHFLGLARDLIQESLYTIYTSCLTHMADDAVHCHGG